MVEFECPVDKLRVIRDGPWHLDKALSLIKDFVGEQQVKDIQMTKVAFWVCVHDLPLMAQNEFVGREVGKALSVVEEVDLEFGEVEWGEFMRIRVSVDVSKPLLRRKKLNIGSQHRCGCDSLSNAFLIFIFVAI